MNCYLILNDNKVKPYESSHSKFTVLGVSNETGIFVNRDINPQDTKQSYYLVEPNQFCYNPYRVNVGSIGLNKFDYENQIISGAYVVFGTDNSKLLSEYLLALFEDKRFLEYVNSKANGGVRMNFTFEELANWYIPLPLLDKQIEIVQQIKKHREITEGANKIVSNYDIDFPIVPTWKRVKISEVCSYIATGNTPSKEKMFSGGGEIPYLKVFNLTHTVKLDFGDKTTFISRETHTEELSRSICLPGDVLMNIVGPPLGKVSIVPDTYPEWNINQAIILFRCNEQIENKYLAYYLLSPTTPL